VAQPVSTRAIEIAGLRKSYGDVHAVRGIDVSIGAGETVALLGPNGAGKSTTIDMILGLSEPDGGTVSVFGGSPTAAVDAGQVGAMLQTGALIRDLSVGELVAMVASLYPASLDVAEELTGLSEIAGQRTQKLSGGQTQRVRFAVALVSDAKLLVLDEPTVAMDVEGRRSFWTTMRELAARGKTILFATHYLEEADAYADRAVLMAHGAIVADGPPTEIRAMVGTRTIRATLPGADLDALAGLPGVSGADRRGEAVVLSCADSDAAIRALLGSFPDARDIEIAAAGLEEAFLQLTAEDADINGSGGGAVAAGGATAAGGSAPAGGGVAGAGGRAPTGGAEAAFGGSAR
jgi:ABC-2 type transport system ATP-binding protein